MCSFGGLLDSRFQARLGLVLQPWSSAQQDMSSGRPTEDGEKKTERRRAGVTLLERLAALDAAKLHQA